MSRRQTDLLLLSILVLSLGFFSALAAAGLIGLLETVPLTIAVMGVSLIFLAVVQREAKSALSLDTVSWGLLMLVIGTMGFLYGRNIYSGFFIPSILIVIGLIGIMAVLRSWRKTA
jgi:hypothetical protein